MELVVRNLNRAAEIAIETARMMHERDEDSTPLLNEIVEVLWTKLTDLDNAGLIGDKLEDLSAKHFTAVGR